MNKPKSNKISAYGLLVALAMILSYVESLIPVFVAVPGIKAGLANIVIVFALYRLGAKDAFIISMIRVVLVAFTFGNMFSMVYSLAGAFLSLGLMIILRKSNKFSITGVSVAGGVAHNIAQIIVAIFVLETSSLIYYLPILFISGTLSGIIIGLLASVMTKRISKI